MKGATITVLCDVVPKNVEHSQNILREMEKPEAVVYTGPDDWKEVCKHKDVDLVYVCTHWDLHTPIAVLAMENGKHVAVEVPAALTVEECWQLVTLQKKHNVIV